MGLFDAGSLPKPNPPASLAERYKRRAYGSITVTGNDQFTGCAGGYTLSFDNSGNGKYSQGGALNARGGGRYTPQPYLTSITTKNQGGGDITDIALWEIEFQYTCWSVAQLDKLSDAFMIPGNLINVKFGWNTGQSVNITGARIYDFSWSYNDDGSWSCTGKALGESSSAGAFRIKPTNSPEQSQSESTNAKSYGPIKALQDKGDKVLGLTRTEDGEIEGNVPSADGTAKSKDGFAIVNLQKAAGAWDMLWSGGAADSLMISFCSMRKLISFLNETSMENGYTIKCDAKYNSDPYIMSADPSSVLLCGAQGIYGSDNNFSALDGSAGVVSDIYVSTALMLKIEDELLSKEKDRTGNPEYTVSTLLSRIFAEIESCTGGAVNCAVIPDPNKKEIVIVNKHFDIKTGSSGTAISILGESSPVKALSMSSNFDPEMAAIAFAGGSGRFPQKMASNIFSGCTPKPPENPPPDPKAAVQEKMDEIGDGEFKQESVSDFKTVMRTYAMGNVTGVSIRYNIDLNLTFDGMAGVKFMQKFTISPLPAGFQGNTYFSVGEIEHKVDGAIWETSIVGYMMVNV